jgi:hypothetical protein
VAASVSPAPPDPGAQPAQGGVVPLWPDQPSGAGGVASAAGGAGTAMAGAGAAGGVMGGGGLDLLQSPRLSAPADVRAFLTTGGADPRMVSVLDSALANHSIALGPVTSLTDPVHVQAVSIVSVDGQSVGPGNFAARDLVTEIAALDPSQRPNEIGTPWPIHSPGFFTDPSQQSQIHLAFLSSADYAPPGGVAAAGPGGVTPGAVAPAPDVAVAPAPAGGGSPALAPDVQVAASPAGGAPAPVDPSSHYVNPLPASARIGRTDMGVDADLNPGDPIVAPGTSRVLGISPNWYQGQPYVALQLLDGPMKGHNYYISEQITPDVSVGQILQSGQPIGHYAASGTGIEMGWAGPNWEQTLAQATGHDNADQGDHADTRAGISFHNFLNGLGHVGGSASAGSAGPVAPPVAPEPVAPESTPPEPVAPGSVDPDSIAPGSATPGSGVDAALSYARAMVGKLPESAGSNLGPQLDRFEADFGFHGSPWCGIFAGHVMEAAGLEVPHSVASVASILDLARNGDPPFLKGVLPVSEARPGDLVTFGGTEHVAVVTKVDAAGVHTIAGNTSQSNVSETTYSPSSVTGVVRPDYAAGTPGSIPGVWDYSGVQPPTADASASVPAPEAPAGGAAPATPAAPDAQPSPDAPLPMPQAAAPPRPGEFAFDEPASHRSVRHTVQFLSAVQPSPGSPLFGQAPGAAAAPPPVTPEPAAAPLPQPSAAPLPEASVQQPSAGGLLDQVPAPATPGGSISVSSSLLTPGQAKFAGRLAELTGLDPHVVAAWELAEESGSAAQGREAASNFNWLNIGYFDSGAGKIAFDKTFSDPISAAEQSAKFLKGEWGGASSSIRAILNSVGHSPDEQMAAIANSDWASSHYGGGANLHGTYNELGDIHIEKNAVE